MESLGYKHCDIFVSVHNHRYYKALPEAQAVVSVNNFMDNQVVVFKLTKAQFRKFMEGKLTLEPPGCVSVTDKEVVSKCEIVREGDFSKTFEAGAYLVNLETELEIGARLRGPERERKLKSLAQRRKAAYAGDHISEPSKASLAVFWFHYNKPASKKAGRPKLTIHFRGKCQIVDEIICSRPTYTEERSQQPRCVVKGKTTSIEIDKGGGFITAYIK